MIGTRIVNETFDHLKSLGHQVDSWADWTWKASAVCMIYADQKNQIQISGADSRRPAYALGW